MAKRDEVFPSKYLKAADLDGKPITVPIESAPEETLKTPDGKEQTSKLSCTSRAPRRPCRST